MHKESERNLASTDVKIRQVCVMIILHRKSQIIILGFLSVILAGTLLLMLPVSARAEGGASFSAAIFTATSAVCVTGLVLYDTFSYWSGFGQFVIMLLIQIGGMGVVTVAVSIAMVSGRKIGLMQRSTMQEAISAPKVGGIVRLTGFILKTALFIELLGTAALAPGFCREFGLVRGIWYGVFHSVSAFCNAGFDLMGEKEAFSSLTGYAADPVVNLTIMLLIIAGGIGFLTWEDIKTNTIHLKRYRMQSKVIFAATAIFICLPALYFYFLEFSAPQWNEIPRMQKIWMALFQSVTPRTAGFNTADLGAFSEAGQALTIILMLIGGSPGSTAGGMKTTTMLVLAASAIAVFRGREDAQCFGRRLERETIRYGAAILFMYLVLVLTGTICISSIEKLPVLTCLFEVSSAIGTVGLSLGITPELGQVSRTILIGLMFFGRVGGLTLVYAALSGARSNISKLPQEKITVG